MKVAFVYHPSLPARPFDAKNLFTSSRGLTGSELSCLMYALHFEKRGHDAAWFGPIPETLGFMRPYSPTEFGPNSDWDAIVAWNTDAVFRETGLARNPLALRILNMQVSDFGWCSPGWEERVDMLAPLSRKHAEFLCGQTTLPRGAMRLMPNGVDLAEFRPGSKVRGRCLWASSHDRGLHHLLGVWPEVRRNVPGAELRILYDLAGSKAHAESTHEGSLWEELRRRARYSLAVVHALRDQGVSLVGSVSRHDVAREMEVSEALAYPCDPVRFTETFGVSVLEAMAAGCVPVTSDADAFGELWCPPARCVTQASLRQDPARYAALLVGVLSDRGMLHESAIACRSHASKFSWPQLAERLERGIVSRGREGLEAA